MTQLKSREKNLGVLVLLVVVALLNQRANRQNRDDADNLIGDLVAARDRVQQSRALMASVPKTVAETDRRPAALNETTMRMLKDVTIPVEIQDVKVVSVDHPTPADFKMVIEGRFGGLMRFLSYLERPDGDFRVNHVDIGRVQAEGAKEGAVDEEAANARALRGTFQLSRRS